MITLNNFKPLLQNDYGDPLDCSLTSITASTMFVLNREDDKNIYDIVETTAKKYGYSGIKYGTFAITIKPIWENVLKTFQGNIPQFRKVAIRTFKGIGYTFETIKKELDSNNPVLLSFSVIKNTKYKNHTVTIVGYEEGYRLIIYDNWIKRPVTIYYSDISFNSSINFIKRG